LLFEYGQWNGQCYIYNREEDRDAIEKSFCVFKTDMDIFALGDHRESSIFNEKYSLERMLLKLERLHMIEDQNGDLKERERTKKQKDILDLLNSVWW